MLLEDGALEVLHRVGLAIRLALFLHLIGDREALLRQPTVAVPVLQEGAADGLAGLLKRARSALRQRAVHGRQRREQQQRRQRG